jgi:hypothetical protein
MDGYPSNRLKKKAFDLLSSPDAPILSTLDNIITFKIQDPVSKKKIEYTEENLNPKPLGEWAIFFRLGKELHYSPDQIEAMDYDMFIWFKCLIESEDQKTEQKLKEANNKPKR